MEKLTTSAQVIENLINKGLWVDPKYRIGDIILYADSDWDYGKDSVIVFYQSKITSAFLYVESGDLEDIGVWFYNTELTGALEDTEHSIYEKDIIKKI